MKIRRHRQPTITGENLTWDLPAVSEGDRISMFRSPKKGELIKIWDVPPGTFPPAPWPIVEFFDDEE